ncbi:hypothetical protein [Natrinema gari]|uniref:Uncharacterized protein n=1 Tax=Natrinema gari JCM 14663 TaxID=1230459 RepID=L9YP60_9EURY|nr:hypothetical protein [Natrinema gari]ELY75461.1 hypothetical protein C486_19703 [Natrinema gari JCM 14663]
MTRQIAAAHERVTLPEPPLEESDEHDALTSGEREATDSDGSATRCHGWSNDVYAVRGSRTTAQQPGEPRNWQ